MKKVLAFLVLLSHMNFTMFIPQLDEVDAYDSNGVQVNDINSLSEYINEVVLGNKNNSPKDEDDDNARYFHIVKLNDWSFEQPGIEIKRKTSCSSTITKFPPFKEQKFASYSLDILSPPPKA